MRQAGRYLPEYQEVRAKFTDFIEFCLTPDAATEVTLQPVTRFDMDAAIIFADILTIPHALGLNVTFTKGHGPRVQPFNNASQLTDMRLHLAAIPTVLDPVSQTVRQVRAALPEDKAVIGFSGGPFTLACYMMDKKPSEGIPNTLLMAEEDPQTFKALLALLTEACTTYLRQQIDAGASAVQVFESWALACPSYLWEIAVEAPLLELGRNLHQSHPNTPVILFPRGASQNQLKALSAKSAGAFHGVSLATETDIGWASQNLQPHVAIQGNLDPLLTEGDARPLQQALAHMLNTAAVHPGYVVNLGHGLTPQTRPDNVLRIVETVKAWQAPQASVA